MSSVVSETKISTTHNKFIDVSGMIQFRNSGWTMQYSLNNGAWQNVPDAPTILNATNEAQVHPWTFFVRLFGLGGIASASDTSIRFRLAKTDSYGNPSVLNSYRVAMRYNNL